MAKIWTQSKDKNRIRRLMTNVPIKVGAFNLPGLDLADTKQMKVRRGAKLFGCENNHANYIAIRAKLDRGNYHRYSQFLPIDLYNLNFLVFQQPLDWIFLDTCDCLTAGLLQSIQRNITPSTVVEGATFGLTICLTRVPEPRQQYIIAKRLFDCPQYTGVVNKNMTLTDGMLSKQWDHLVNLILGSFTNMVATNVYCEKYDGINDYPMLFFKCELRRGSNSSREYTDHFLRLLKNINKPYFELPHPPNLTPNQKQARTLQARKLIRPSKLTRAQWSNWVNNPNCLLCY